MHEYLVAVEKAISGTYSNSIRINEVHAAEIGSNRIAKDGLYRTSNVTLNKVQNKFISLVLVAMAVAPTRGRLETAKSLHVSTSTVTSGRGRYRALPLLIE